MRIGIDFDNTIIDYNDIFVSLAGEYGWMELAGNANKQTVRDKVRELPDGENKWIKLQALAYGEKILEARPFGGALAFIKKCHAQAVPVFVVSHKTQYAELAEEKKDLRQQALIWLEQNGFFSEGTGLSGDNVFFDAEREGKLGHIKNLGCTHFIDDLQEVFAEPGFPQEVVRILFTHGGKAFGEVDYPVFANWKEIEGFIFDNDC